MKKEQLAFLAVGFAFGILVGFGAYNAFDAAPELDGQASAGTVQGPAGPTANSRTASDAGAPMMAEIRALKRRIQQDPQDHEALVRLANLYHDGNMLDDAIGFYEMALAVRPDEPDQLTDMGICYRGKRDFERALELFEKANAIDPKHWQSLFNYVVVAGFDLGRFDEAREALTAMEQLDPPPPRLEDLRQALEQAAGRPGEAAG